MERPSLPEVPLLHGLHSTLSLSGATKISRYLIRAKWDREGGGRVRCGPWAVCYRVTKGGAAGWTLPTNQIYLVFSVTWEPSCDPSRHVGTLST